MQSNQWQQYPYQQGGVQPQFTNTNNPSFLNSQPTGFQPQLQPMQTGFQPQQQRPQQTGMPTGGVGGIGGGAGGNYSFLNQPPPQSNFRGNLTPQMTGFPGGGASGLLPQQTGFPGGMGGGGSGMLPQQTGYQGMMSQPTGFQGGGGLMSQPTGMGRLQAQPTGLPHDPRLQSMMQSFMPSNISQPFSGGVPQFAQTPGAQPLQQTFQSLLQNPAVATPKVPWTLSRQEKKDYDQIFRAWDKKGDGFISGEMAREVFGQSGLGQDDLMKIWNLSDVDNRGKLNLPEFHVAMGLIYRALNGNQIPDKLPEELVPASMRDIDTTVNFMKDLLRHEASSRSATASPSYGGSGTPPTASSKDALMYKHSDETPSTYKPSGRHLDRKSVRYAGEDPDAGLQDIRRKLQNTSSMLEKTSEKSKEDEDLEEEVEELQYRVKRIQEDIEYTTKGRRTAEKDEERRKLERELLFLMHEKLPELERRQERRREEKAMEERAGVRRRDDRNRTYGRYDDRDRDRDEYERDRYRGTFDRERERERDRERERSRDRYDYDRDRRGSRDDRSREYGRRDSRDRRDSYDRPRSPTGARSPPPAPPPASSAATATSAPPPPPAPTSAAAVPSTKNMTPEERKAFIREQAQKRINERLRALGVESAPQEHEVDTSVQDRLEKEKKEAEEKSKQAEEEQKARDEVRRKRFTEAGGGVAEEAPVPASAQPKSALKKPVPPPAPHSRTAGAKAPPPPPVSRAHPPAPTPAAPAPPPAPPAPKALEPEEDPEEIELRRREEAAAKAKAERKARLEALQREEEEERKQEEALLVARKNRSLAPSPGVGSGAVSPAAPAPPPAPPAPPGPPAPAAQEGSYNPFRKPGAAPANAASPATTSGGHNPFYKPQAAAGASPAGTPAEQPAAAAPPAPAPPPPPPAPPAPAPPSAFQAPPRQAVRSPPSEPEWEDITEKQVDESDSDSDDDFAASRAGRQGLAQALFGNILPPTGSRPGSAGPTSATPKPPSAALQNLGGGDAKSGMGALLSSIQGGARLRKAQTVDKSAPPGTGKVIGDAAPPAHINTAAPEPQQGRAGSPAPPSEDSYVGGNPNRQSVDWYASLAADASHPAGSVAESGMALDPTREEPELEQEQVQAYTPLNGGYEEVKTPEVRVEGAGDELEEFDLATTIRVRSLYEFVGSRDVDLSFKEDVVIEAHPSKDESSPWWYGTIVKDGSKGWFPKNYVEQIKITHAKALYEYAAGEADQLPFAEGDVLDVVDTSDESWWKVELAGVIFLVPAAYLEIQDDAKAAPKQEESLVDKADGYLGGLLSAVGLTDGDKSAPEPEAALEQKAITSPTTPAPSTPFPTSPVPDHSTSLSSAPPTPALNAPRPTGRARAESTLSIAASFVTEGDDDDGSSSSDDSMLSWWSDDGSDDESESGETSDADDEESGAVAAGPSGGAEQHQQKERRAAPKPPAAKKDDAAKEAERKRREEQRQAVLAATGLQLRREPPGIPGKGGKVGRAVSRRKAPAVPGRQSKALPSPPEEAGERLETQDAYARYESFLANAATTQRPEPIRVDSRPASQVLSPQLTGPAGGAALSPSSTTTSLPGSGTMSLGRESGGKISGFFSRMMTSHQPGHERKAPSISGPITRVDEPSAASSPYPSSPSTPAPGAGAATDGFGKTWSSLVEPTVLDTMDSRERKRQEAIFEFIATESAYNRDLQLIVEVFYASLLSILDDKALTVIFANIEDILLFNTVFLSELEERQKAARLYIDRIGDVLSALKDADVYMTYCVNQQQAIKLLQTLRQEKPELEAHLQNIRETNPSVRGLDLSSYLLIPMQRITRYPLLIKQIIAYTAPDSPDMAPLEAVAAVVAGIVSRVNESVREAEGQERLRALSEHLWIGGEGRLDLTAPTAFMGPRKLLKEGSVSKAKSGRKLSMVLCNDIIVLLDGTDLYRMPIALHEVQIKQARDQVGFVLKLDQRRGGDTIALRATSQRDAKEWLSKIDGARRKALGARKYQ
ncbi:hypothetical protein IAT38_005775 [Cryptococcus sp. DSM 104549]